MKRCVIFFTLLLITLIIAVWTENRQQVTTTDDMALRDQQPKLLDGMETTLKK